MHASVVKRFSMSSDPLRHNYFNVKSTDSCMSFDSNTTKSILEITKSNNKLI